MGLNCLLLTSDPKLLEAIRTSFSQLQPLSPERFVARRWEA
jgi:hypothetical protein